MVAGVVRLRAEYRDDAFGIGSATPRLSWIVEADESGWVQSGYEVRAEDPEGDGGESTDLIPSVETVFVEWPFAPLRSRQRRRIAVRVAGPGGELSEWSAPLDVEAGLLDADDWQAVPVSVELDGVAPERPIRFRRSFTVRPGLVRARLYASALGIYTAELNGARVGDHVLAPGWTSYHHRLRYQTFDVTSLLHDGDNAIGMTVAEGWYRGRFGFEGGKREIFGSRIGPIAQLELVYGDGEREVLATDGTWRAGLGPHLAAGLYDGETYDARLADASWSSAWFDDASWSAVEELPAVAGVLVAPSGPPVRRIETLAAVSIFTSPSGKTIVDFGQNISGRVRVTVHGERGERVRVRHAEVLEHGELGVRPLRLAAATDEYVLAGGGAEVYEPDFTIHGFRYAEISGWPGVLSVEEIEAVVCHSDMEPTGTFDCSHLGLVRLHDNVRWSMRGNFVDVPTDCPQRDERLGWTGDLQVFAPTASFLYDCNGFLSSWLEDLAAEQRELGMVPVYVPFFELKFPVGAVAAWGDAAVIVPWVLYERFGDVGVLARQFASMTAWVDLVDSLAGEDHLWNTGLQLGDWLDPTAPPDQPWAARTDRSLVATAYFAHSARLVARAAEVLGRKEDRRRYETLADRIVAAFNDEYVTPNGRLLSDAPTAYALALRFELLPAASRERAADRLVELIRRDGYRIGTGFVGTPLVCDALADADRVDDAYHLLLQEQCPSWLYPVTMGATTIWERWDSMLPDGSINPGEMTSFNHYALGAIADFLQRVVAGLAPAAPGYRRLLVAPRPGGGLTHAAAALRTPYGQASVRWVREGERLTLDVAVPAGSSATVRLPGADPVEVGPGRHELHGIHRAPEDDPPRPPDPPPYA